MVHADKFVRWENVSTPYESISKGYTLINCQQISGVYIESEKNKNGNTVHIIQHENVRVGINDRKELRTVPFTKDKQVTFKWINKKVIVEFGKETINPHCYILQVVHNPKRGDWFIQSYIKGSSFSFGTFKTEKYANQHREYLLTKKDLSYYPVLKKSERYAISKKLKEIYSEYYGTSELFNKLDEFYSFFEPVNFENLILEREKNKLERQQRKQQLQEIKQDITDNTRQTTITTPETMEQVNLDDYRVKDEYCSYIREALHSIKECTDLFNETELETVKQCQTLLKDKFISLTLGDDFI